MSSRTFFNGKARGECGMASATERILEELQEEGREPLVTSIWYRIRNPKTGEYGYRWWGHGSALHHAVWQMEWREKRRLEQEEYDARKLVEEKRRELEAQRHEEMEQLLEMKVADLENSPDREERMLAAFKRMDAGGQARLILMVESFEDSGGAPCKVLQFTR